jgi:hypothetical protein
MRLRTGLGLIGFQFQRARHPLDTSVSFACLVQTVIGLDSGNFRDYCAGRDEKPGNKPSSYRF